MKITIVGAGNMAYGIGTRLATSSHNINILARDLEKAKALAEKIGSSIMSGSLSSSSFGDVVILALPYTEIAGFLDNYSDELRGKIIVDISNPIDFSKMELISPEGISGVEENSKHLPEGASIVKAFNTTFAGTLAAGMVDGKILDVFIASDNKESAETIASIVNESGLRGLYVGPLNRARALEGMLLIHIGLQEKLGTKFMSTIKILS